MSSSNRREGDRSSGDSCTGVCGWSGCPRVGMTWRLNSQWWVENAECGLAPSGWLEVWRARAQKDLPWTPPGDAQEQKHLQEWHEWQRVRVSGVHVSEALLERQVHQRSWPLCTRWERCVLDAALEIRDLMDSWHLLNYEAQVYGSWCTSRNPWGPVSWGCGPWFSGHTGVTLAWTDLVSEGPVSCMNKAMEEFTVLCPQTGR